MKWLQDYVCETKWMIKQIKNYSLIFFQKLWRPWGTKGKRMTFRQSMLYSKTLMDILEIVDVLDLERHRQNGKQY